MAFNAILFLLHHCNAIFLLLHASPDLIFLFLLLPAQTAETSPNQCIKLISMPCTSADIKAVNMLLPDQRDSILHVYAPAIQYRYLRTVFSTEYFIQASSNFRVHFFRIFNRRRFSIDTDRPYCFIGNHNMIRHLRIHALETEL